MSECDRWIGELTNCYWRKRVVLVLRRRGFISFGSVWFPMGRKTKDHDIVELSFFFSFLVTTYRVAIVCVDVFCQLPTRFDYQLFLHGDLL